jgi:trimethylamine--corrinoid protein Co-methyltransferase
MSDSKLPDVQAGYEKGVTLSLAGQAGGNMVYEAAGMHASLLGFCLESCVIDNDIIGMVQRSLRGIEVSEENLSIGPVREVCIDGPGHFLGHDQTLALMERDYLYPEIGDRLSPKAWKEAGAPSIVARAREKVEEVLARHYPRHVDPALDAAVRARFPVRLPVEALGTKTGR